MTNLPSESESDEFYFKIQDESILETHCRTNTSFHAFPLFGNGLNPPLSENGESPILGVDTMDERQLLRQKLFSGYYITKFIAFCSLPVNFLVKYILSFPVMVTSFG